VYLRRCARLSCFAAFWVTKYNTPSVFRLPSTQRFFRIPYPLARCPWNCAPPLLASSD
jgi:hypothetical protein